MFNPPTRLPDVAPVRPPPEPESPHAEPTDEVSAAREVAAAKRSPKESTLRREAPGERLVLNLPPDLIKRMRHQCVEEGRSLSNAAELAIRAWLDARPR
jgi:hypothetical protein